MASNQIKLLIFTAVKAHSRQKRDKSKHKH